MNIAEKLYLVADHLHELNSKGKVKGFSGNENGYAKIIQIIRGCSVWIHHEKNNELIIDLMVSPPAFEKRPLECEESIALFKDYFGFLIENSGWTHCIDKHNDYDRYYVVVSNLSVDKIINHTEKLKEIFA